MNGALSFGNRGEINGLRLESTKRGTRLWWWGLSKPKWSSSSSSQESDGEGETAGSIFSQRRQNKTSVSMATSKQSYFLRDHCGARWSAHSGARETPHLREMAHTCALGAVRTGWVWTRLEVTWDTNNMQPPACIQFSCYTRESGRDMWGKCQVMSCQCRNKPTTTRWPSN